MSEVWNHFKVDIRDAKYAICNHCGSRISRGVSKSTSNLKKHISKHKQLVGKKLCSDEDSPPPSSLHEGDAAAANRDVSLNSESGSSSNSSSTNQPKMVQPTLAIFMKAKNKFKPGDARSIEITRLLAELICIDCQPFSIVEDRGFNNLISYIEPRYVMPSRKHLANKVVPDLYSELRGKVVTELQKSEYVAITTDMWTSTANTDYMSLTVHYIDDLFELKQCCIEVIPFPEVSHTAENLCDFITATLKEWGLDNKVVAVVRDNGRNVVAGLEMSQFAHISCLAHTFQLVVKDGFLNNKSITDLVAKCRELVGYFKHSAKACKVLKLCQSMTKVPLHRLVQDDPTRWNSTLHMLQRLFEQRPAIVLAGGELKLPVELKNAEWTTIENCIPILKIFDSATSVVSSEKVISSEVIPFVHLSRHELEKCAPPGSGLQGLRNELIAHLNLRYTGVEDEDLFTLPTLLDPRLKAGPFREGEKLQKAKEKLIRQAEALDTVPPNSTVTEVSLVASTSTHKPTSSEKNVSCVWSRYKSIFKEQVVENDKNNSAEHEVVLYLSEPLLSSNVNIFSFWKNDCKFPRLKKLAKKYLCIPPATVASERLFSTAGNICDKKRNRLDPERLKMLVFLHKNL